MNKTYISSRFRFYSRYCNVVHIFQDPQEANSLRYQFFKNDVPEFTNASLAPKIEFRASGLQCTPLNKTDDSGFLK